MKVLPLVCGLLATMGPLHGMARAETHTVYRCGQTYQQVPCSGATPVEVKDSRSASQHADAKEAASAERRQAKDLAAERREREKAIKPQSEPMGIVQPADPPASEASATGAQGKKRRGGKGKADNEPTRYRAPPAPATSTK